MTYIPTGQFTKAHREALHVTPEELRALPAEDRAAYSLRLAEVKAQQRSAIFDALAAAIPIITFLGLERVFRGR